MDKKENLMIRIKQQPIRWIIRSVLEADESRKGMENDPGKDGFLCPFHEDRNSGNFKIYTDREGNERYHCFVCAGDDSKTKRIGDGDVIDFVKNLRKCSFEDALKIIADQAGFSEGRNSPKDTKKTTLESSKYEAGNSVKRKDCEFTHMIYSILSQGMKLCGSDTDVLSKEDRAYLNGRGIPDEEIAANGYFTMPDEEAAMKKLSEKLQAKGYSQRDLLGVPGFFRDPSNDQIHMTVLEGIGIPLKDAYRRISAIQVRSREGTAGKRYKYFSSSFTRKKEMHEKAADGMEPIASAAVVFPVSCRAEDQIAVTEGMFKAARFAATYGSFAVSIQGISNTKGVIPSIQALIEQGYVAEHPKILLGIDMDIFENRNVFKAAVKLRRKLEENGFEVFYLNWKPESGKGIDDCIVSGHFGEIRATRAADFESRVKKSY